MTENTTFLPVYEESKEKNTEYLRQCLPLMVQNNVSANPINYAIWYDYVSGNNIKLVKDVDQIVDGQQPFDSETSFELYKKHICNASVESFENINQQLLKLVKDSLKTAEVTGKQATQASNGFQEKSDALASVTNADDIKVIVTELIKQSNSMAATSEALKGQLESAHQQMDEMQNELLKVKEIAVTDALTGLYNRRAFDDALDAMVRKKDKACLAILDLDHFKKVNDTYGHQVGDNVLKFTATLLKKQVKEFHQPARYGGEEMAIIMPQTSLSQALDITESIRSTLASSQLKRKGKNETIGQITVSIGVTEFKPNDDAESLIQRADGFLYKAKESGRNKVVSQ